MSSGFSEWLTSKVQELLNDQPGWPGIQLTVSSRKDGLNCTTSVQSDDEKFSKNPALLDDTPWRLASITKTFTAVAILQLVELRQVDLHKPAAEYLPAWASDQVKQSQGSEYARQITVWHLLHHTSGLGDFASNERWMVEVLADPQQSWTPQSLIQWSTLNSEAVGYPGETFHYSDTGYTLLGLIVEQVTGNNLAEAVRELTRLDELGMPSTWWEQLEKQPKDAKARAGQYFQDIDVTNFNPTFDLFGAGGLIGNSSDLNCFGRALLEGKLLNKESMRLLCTLDNSGVYGSGVVKYSFAGHEAWGHTGFWGTWLYWVPSLDLVISGANNKARDGAFDADQFVKELIGAGFVKA